MPDSPTPPPSPPPDGTSRSSLRARMRVYAILGIAVVGGWLYFTITAVRALYESTLQIAQFTELGARVDDGLAGLQEASDSLDRYTREGQGYDLSEHYFGRTALKTSLGAIRRQALTEGARGLLRRAEAAEEVFATAAEKAIGARAHLQPGESFALRDNEVGPARDRLRDVLMGLEQSFSRGRAVAEQQLRGHRDAATIALVVLAALIAIGLLWLLADVNKRILSPCATAARGLSDLVHGRPIPRLFEASRDEVGDLGRNFNELSRLYTDRARVLEARDIEASVNAVLAAAATVNDLAGFGSRVLEKVLDVTGASSAVLYLSDGRGGFVPSVRLGGSPGDSEATGRESAARAARDGRPLRVSVGAETPTVDVFDGRILPRESLHLPLMYFGEAAGILALGSVAAFSDRALNTLTAIAPSLAVALANASANERLAEQSRRLTEQNELLEQQRARIARTARELQRASALKDRFLAAVSHELRTPMTVILGFTGTLLRGSQGALNPKQHESLERVQRNARLLLGLINDVLDISKIESGKADVQREEVPVAGLLAQVQTDFEGPARQKGLALRTSVSGGLDTVVSDSAKLTQILSNLVGNALKFTERGLVEVLAEPRGESRWALVVTDSGIGIPPDELDVIFEEFRQGESTSHQGRGGTGLGLAIARKLAILLGGDIAATSAPGQGSSFSVVLPRGLPAAPDVAMGADSAPGRRAQAPGGRRVLVVDDDENTRRLLRFELEPYGLTVTEAEDGPSAVAAARHDRPDAIVLDVMMPGMDGWAVLRLLKDNPDTRDIPVVIHTVVDERAFGFSLGAVDCIAKPVEPARLLAALERAGVAPAAGTVLIVDDDPGIRELLERETASAGFRARAVAGGAEALDVLESERPTAVLLDLVMPEPDGFEVLYRMRDDPRLKDLPVFVLTGKDLSAEDSRRLTGSVQRVFAKGADMTRLVRDILRMLEEELEKPPAAAAARGSWPVS